MADVVKDRIFTHDQGDTMNNKLDAINNTLTARLTDREFANVLVGSTTVQATLKGDTLNLVAGDNITLTPDNANKRITINAPNMVKTSGAQTIAGVKTFSDVPLISGSLAATDDSTKAATTAYVKDNVPKSVGSSTKPVYTDSNGKVVASGSTVGSAEQPIYMSGGTFTAGGKIIPIQANAGFHNSIFRGKNLGTSVTSAQRAAITAGTFEDLFIGDYWVIDSRNWRIAAFDYWYNVGDTAWTKHHVVIVPDTNLYSTQMNDTNTTEGGYLGSALYAGLDTARTTIKNAFGAANIPTHRLLLPSTCTGGHYTSWAWTDTDVTLMNEVMVFGTKSWSNPDGQGRSVASQDSQLPLFHLSPVHRHTRQSYWLMDVASASWFAIVFNFGLSSFNNASNSLGVRPAFALI